MDNSNNGWVESNKSLIDSIDELDWGSGEYGVMTGFTKLDDMTDGLQPGFYVVGGHPGAGKSTFMTQLALQALEINPKVCWSCFSIDDSKKFQINRMAAMMGNIGLNDVRYPSRMQNDILEKRANGYNILKKYADRWRVYDQSDYIDQEELSGSSINIILDRIVEDYERFEEVVGERPSLLVTIDAFNNIDLSGTGFIQGASDIARQEFLGSKLKDGVHLATTKGTPVLPMIMVSTHLRKNDQTRPTLEDVKGSNSVGYHADLVILCYNELEIRGEEEAKAYDEEEVEEVKLKFGVVEIDVAKSKLAHKKGKFLCTLDWRQTKLIEKTDPIDVQEYFSKVRF